MAGKFTLLTLAWIFLLLLPTHMYLMIHCSTEESTSATTVGPIVDEQQPLSDDILKFPNGEILLRVLKEDREKEKKKNSSPSNIDSATQMKDKKDLEGERKIIDKTLPIKKKKSLCKDEDVDKEKKIKLAKRKESEKKIILKDPTYQSKKYYDIVTKFERDFKIKDLWDKEIEVYRSTHTSDIELYECYVNVVTSFKYNVESDMYGKTISDDNVKKRLRRIYEELLINHQFFAFPITTESEGKEVFVEPTTDTKPHKMKIEKVLGRGKYGIVFLCSDLDDSGKKYALKHYFDLYLQKGITYKYSTFGYNDLSILTESLRQPHPNIVTPQFVSFDMLIINKISYPFIPDVIFKLIEQQFDLVVIIRCDPLKNIRAYLFHVLSVLEFIHNHGVIHRDVSTGNIFITKDGNVILGDFGLAVDLKNRWSEKPSLSSNVYAWWYRAPEIYSQVAYTTTADIWALGATVMDLLTESTGSIFEGVEQYEMLEEIDTYYKFTCEYKEGIPYSSKFKRVINCIRFIAEKCGKQNTVPLFLDLLVKMLQYDPQKRISAKKALRHPLFFDKSFD